MSKPRLETGVVQVDGDHPGIFIRGDQALAFARALDVANKPLANHPTPLYFGLKGLARLLRSCDAANKPEVQPITLAPEGKSEFESETVGCAFEASATTVSTASGNVRIDRIQITSGIAYLPNHFREIAVHANLAGLDGFELTEAEYGIDVEEAQRMLDSGNGLDIPVYVTLKYRRQS